MDKFFLFLSDHVGIMPAKGEVTVVEDETNWYLVNAESVIAVVGGFWLYFMFDYHLILGHGLSAFWLWLFYCKRIICGRLVIEFIICEVIYCETYSIYYDILKNKLRSIDWVLFRLTLILLSMQKDVKRVIFLFKNWETLWVALDII